MSQDIEKLSGTDAKPLTKESRWRERAVDREAMIANAVRIDSRTSSQDSIPSSKTHMSGRSATTASPSDALRSSLRDGGSGSVDASPPKGSANSPQANTHAADLARESASAQSTAKEKLKARATMQARLRFLNKDATVAFKDKTGLTYQFDREALEQLLEQLGSDAETVDIGGHNIPLGVFDDGVNSFAELDQARVENGLVPLFSAATT
ncbi:MAG: hypothetical protein ACRCWJ_10610 [Casimicrobium sp.]